MIPNSQLPIAVKRPLLGIFWFCLSLVVCSGNDVLMKYLGNDFHNFQVVFLRFFFGTLSLLPWMIFSRKKAFRTRSIGFYVLRGTLLFGGVCLWCQGLRTTPIAVASSIDFSIPILTMLLAMPFLGERISAKRWIVAGLGFLGVWIVLHPGQNSFPFRPAIGMMAAALMFAYLDILNKKYLLQEGVLTILFYTALLTMLLAAIPALRIWRPIPSGPMLLFFALGCGANLILYCILKAFEQVEVSAVVPFRYVELILAALFGYLFFDEGLSLRLFLGASVIALSSLYLAWEELREAKESDKNHSSFSCC
ncbi:MAG: DMT family transporter [Puniceicoccales bacterium]|jgi:S-adenosylmethionine uptake transporter|nr:DMT family transporter [Puniceicoccales bacterium]